MANSLFITGCLKTTWTRIKETGGSSTEDRETDKSREKNIHANYHRQVSTYAPAVVLNQGSAEKTQGEIKENGRNANQVVLRISRKLS
jgi:hypothetical protein